MSRRLLRWVWAGVGLLLVALSGRGAPPVHGASDLVIYADTLAAGWADWSWNATIDLNQTGVVHAGTQAVGVQYNAAHAGFSLRYATPIATAGYTALEFWAYGAAGGSPIVLYAQSTDDGGAGTPYAFTAPAGVWSKVSVPLAALGSPAQIARVNWQENTGAAQAVYYLDDVRLVAAPDPDPDPDPGAAITLQVNAGANRKPISPYIYGVNNYDLPADAAAYLQALGIPLRRWGGNATSRYNYQNDISNHAADWYFGNVKESDAGNLPADSAVNRLIAGNKQSGADTLLVIPTSGYVANDNAVACGFGVAKYGAQQATAAGDFRPDCGNGVRTNGTRITGNDPLDTSIAVNEQFVRDWIVYLKGRYGAANAGGVRFYNLDNEPDIWFETHRDIRPTGLTYDEFAALGTTYGAAIKQADPTAQVLGPVLMGWTYYWHSPYDGQREDWGTPDDRNAHGGTPFVPWYLRQMKAYQDAHGVRVLDYLDLHYYPQSGVALTGAGDAALQAKRLRATRSLWDPTYVDESWIKDAGPDGGIVKLIPRMREWVAAEYPGTMLAIGEYNWGALDHINGALAQADVLGIFGREGVDLATLWSPPALDDPGAFAFRLYRNYDGQSSRFGETSVQATSSDQAQLAVYAAQRSGDQALTVMVINKTGGALAGQVQLSQFTPGGPGQVYRYSTADLTKITRPANQAVTATGFSASFPANSITLFVIPAAGPGPDPDPDPDPTPGLFLPLTER